MKRVLFLLILIISSITAFAKPPRLAVEEIFDGRYNNEKTVSTSIYKNRDYYRGMTIKNNPKIIKKIEAAINKDRTRATNFSDYRGEDGQYIVLSIINNGETITVGLQRENSESAYFFIKGNVKAFE